MNTQEIKQLYHYNSWANNKYFDAVSQVPADQYLQDMKSSHGGLHGTFLHIIAAQKMWLSRWNGTPDKALVKQDEIQTLADLKSL